MRFPHKNILLITLAISLSSEMLATIGQAGLYFSDKDWEIACDNTGTCRAAGYQSETPEAKTITVQLTRRAGTQQQVLGELQIGDDAGKEPPPKTLKMSINGKELGVVVFEKDSYRATLSSNQVNELSKAVVGDVAPIWTSDKSTWSISTAGATAVFLKMDEFQKRVDTTDALAKKGARGESDVLQPTLEPTIYSQPFLKLTSVDKEWVKMNIDGVRKAIIATKTENCPINKRTKFRFVKLSDSKYLASTPQHNLKLVHFCYAKYQVLKSPPSGKFVIANDRSKPNQQSMLIPVKFGAHSATTDRIVADTCILMTFPASVDPARLGAVIERLRR